MNKLRSYIALLLAFLMMVSSWGYAEEIPPFCCEGGAKACCPVEQDGKLPDCCAIKVDYHQMPVEAVFFALPSLEIPAFVSDPMPLLRVWLRVRPWLFGDAAPLDAPFFPPPKDFLARSVSQVLARVQCWRL
ncbi:MAG: hypothetical protein ACFCUI_06570 [Bernardetiaceae bacterium]